METKLITQYTVFSSPLGPLTAVANHHGLKAVYMSEHKRRPSLDALGTPVLAVDNPFLAAAVEQLGQYFAGTRKNFDVPLAPAGNDFQQRVWAALVTIPFGESRSYGDLAQMFGNRSMAQAVGSANGRNPISIIVPCHRVVGADGSLVGYAGGLERKEFLLELENPLLTHTEALF